MRKMVLLLVGLMLLSVIATGCISKVEAEPETLSIEDKLVGEWGNDDISFIFNEDKSIAIVLDNYVISSENERGCSWEINTDSVPYHLDIMFVKHDVEDEFAIMAILRFLADDKIQIYSTGLDERPESFIDANDDDLLVLTRQ